MKQPILTTGSLTLRSFDPNDVSAVQILAGNYNVSKSTLNIPHPYEDGMAEKWIGSHQETWNTKTGIVYAVTITKTDTLVGAISLHDIDGCKVSLDIGSANLTGVKVTARKLPAL